MSVDLQVPRIFFNSALDDPLAWEKALRERLGPLEFIVGPDCACPQAIDIALVWTLPEQGLTSFSGLRAVLSLGAGVDQLAFARLPPSVPLARLVDASLIQRMVEYARACVFRYHRRLHVFESLGRERRWSWMPPVLASDRVIGVLGLGEIGREVALAMRADGFQVHGWSRSQKHLADVSCHSGEQGLHALLAVSDVLINVLPLTDATRGILDADLFGRCKKNVCLINIGRGEHLVEDDLLHALASGAVEAATLDVVAVEPLPVDHAFWDHPAILITPHVAGLPSAESAVEQVAENIQRAMANLPLLNGIDTSRGY